MENIQSGHDNYKSAGIVGAMHTVLMALEAFGTQEQFNQAQSDWHQNIRSIRQESKRASEIRRAREQEIAAQSKPQKTPPVPQLVNTFGHAYAHILGGNTQR